MKKIQHINIKNASFSATLIFFFNFAVCQIADADTLKIENVKKQSFTKYIFPATCVSYGITSPIVPSIRDIDFAIGDNQSGYQVTTVDDYLIYAPLVSNLALSLGGVHSKYRFRDKALIYLLSTGLNAVLVYPTKKFTSRARPDNSDFHSFPSGHTSNAFVGAEFFWQEYKDKSKLLASTGYIIAATTGYLRLRNNKHWLSDVVAGAGTGILSTRLVYNFYPRISKKLLGTSQKLVLLPFSSFDAMGVSAIVGI